MLLVNPYLIVDLPTSEVEKALGAWRWVIGPDPRPCFVTAAGDVILIDDSGRIFLLDTGAGTVDQIAESVEAFEDALSDPENVADWFAASVVEQLRASGVVLGPGQCYGYTTLPVFAEGSYGPENRFVLSALEHIDVTADIHHQIKDYSDGARLRVVIKR